MIHDSFIEHILKLCFRLEGDTQGNNGMNIMIKEWMIKESLMNNDLTLRFRIQIEILV